MNSPSPAEPVWSDRLDLGEGIRWLPGGPVLVDIPGGRLLRGPLGHQGGPLDELARLDVPLGAVAPVAGRPGQWIAAAGTGICLFRTGHTRARHAAPHWLARPEDTSPVPIRMNDGTADPHGRFWAGSMPYAADEGAGSLYRVDHDGTVHRVFDGLTVPNGPAFRADGTALYLADSARGTILMCRIDPRTGEPAHAPEEFATVRAGYPDGMAVDIEGGVWSAIWGEGRVHHYRADGTLDQVLPLPARQPAGLCLGGADLRTLYITTARTGLTAPAPADGAVFTARATVPGFPTAAFRPAATLSVGAPACR
ncbi:MULTISPECIES: SMP-30/gluconolactonase/LRE family protein [Streptomyces]|uniref:SMP-30/gluconolactonase/LRE family protein n=1 Tax=Streptomyces TaxID=1883 RepID=UPI00069A1146|nr:SMP-30/gluconolactonase/LRE family protein [Streptomyces sp. SID7805]MYU56209.1 SMP-30/gluconolactonase/LRE family protein [Streptomyces sp. SID7805]